MLYETVSCFDLLPCFVSKIVLSFLKMVACDLCRIAQMNESFLKHSQRRGCRYMNNLWSTKGLEMPYYCRM